MYQETPWTYPDVAQKTVFKEDSANTPMLYLDCLVSKNAQVNQLPV